MSCVGIYRLWNKSFLAEEDAFTDLQYLFTQKPHMNEYLSKLHVATWKPDKKLWGGGMLGVTCIGLAPHPDKGNKTFLVT